MISIFYVIYLSHYYGFFVIVITRPIGHFSFSPWELRISICYIRVFHQFKDLHFNLINYSNWKELFICKRATKLPSPHILFFSWRTIYLLYSDRTRADKLMTSPMVMHTITSSVDYNLWLKRSNIQLKKIKQVTKVDKLTKKKTLL